MSMSSSVCFYGRTESIDIDPESPMLTGYFPQESTLGGSNRLISGARLTGTDTDGRFTFFGFTTNWSGGFSTPDITVAWIPEAFSLVDEYRPDFWITDQDRNMFATFLMQGQPDTWTSFTVHDLPDMSTFDTDIVIPFDFDVPVRFPDWTAATLNYHIRTSSAYGALSQDNYQWTVLVHPETATFSFADLPWPTGGNMDIVLPSTTLFFGVVARCYDADPYAGYVIWTDDAWAEAHYTATLGDSRYRIARP